MKISSECILHNINTLESVKKDFPILNSYENESDPYRKRQIWSECSLYGLQNYTSFIDLVNITKENNQEIFYKKKIKIKDFQEIVTISAIDENVKKSLKSKGKISFAKLINSSKWDIYSGDNNYRLRKKYANNFSKSQAIIANFCIQNGIEIDSPVKINEFYTSKLTQIDPSIKQELDLTNEVVDYIVNKLSEKNYDFKKLNVDGLNRLISDKLSKKIIDIDQGESVKLIDESEFHKHLTFGKVYNIISKDFQSGRLTIQIENDLGLIRRYPYRIFETVSNLRNNAIDDLLQL